MYNRLIALAAVLALPAWGQTPVPVIDFESVANPLHLPKDVYFGEVSGVAVNSKGHVFVFSRTGTSGPAYAATAAQLFEFGADGKFIREIGKDLYAWSFAHAVRVDKDDNIWAVDKGSDMVVKFDGKDGRVLMVFGRKQEASDEDTAPLKHPKPPLPAEDGRFRQVTDVAFGPAGEIYISDGYINSRVAKADKNGVWLKSWGERGDKPGEFNTPHSIATDAAGNVYVADRFNRRIQVFDGDGNFLRAITIDVPFDHDVEARHRQQARSRCESRGHSRRAHRGLCASRHRPTRCSSLPTRIRGASTSFRSTERCWASGRGRQAAAPIRLDPRDRVPQRAHGATWPSSSTGVCRSYC